MINSVKIFILTLTLFNKKVISGLSYIWHIVIRKENSLQANNYQSPSLFKSESILCAYDMTTQVPNTPASQNIVLTNQDVLSRDHHHKTLRRTR
jgi:hypothetical protein